MQTSQKETLQKKPLYSVRWQGAIAVIIRHRDGAQLVSQYNPESERIPAYTQDDLADVFRFVEHADTRTGWPRATNDSLAGLIRAGRRFAKRDS